MGDQSSGLAILLTGGTLDKITSAAYLAASAVAMGRRVSLFFSWEPLLRLSRGTLGEAPIPSGSSLDESSIRAAMAGQPGPDALLADLREAGMKIYACTATMKMLCLDEKDLADRVDEFSGATAFLAMAEDCQILSF